MLIHFCNFSCGYVFIKGGKFYFLKYLFTFFPLAMYKKIKLYVILRDSMLIQGATFIVFVKWSRGYFYIQTLTLGKEITMFFLMVKEVDF